MLKFKIIISVLFISTLIFLSSCEKQRVTSSEEIKRYFPLAVGNSWTYKRTVLKSPVLYSMKFMDSAKNEKLVISSCFINSGTESYTIASQEEDGVFRIEVKDENKEDGVNDIRDGRYFFQELKEVMWRQIKDKRGNILITEVRKGTEFDTDIVSSNIYGLFTPNETIEVRCDFGGTSHLQALYNFDENFNLVEPQLGWMIELPESEDKKDYTWKVRLSCEKYNNEVMVPAGHFKSCIKNSYESIGGKDFEKFTIVSYYARDVGLIKEVQYDSKGNPTYTLELLSYYVK